MKANEAPEKLYLIQHNGLICYCRNNNDDIEYTSTDAFIEKALKWYCLDCECNDNCKDTKCFFYREYERYLKGGTNAIPPKFSDRILNEDGSTSDNWRYRHFIAKIQDAFIVKAVGRLKHYLDNGVWIANDVGYREKEAIIEDFRRYLEGE